MNDPVVYPGALVLLYGPRDLRRDTAGRVYFRDEDAKTNRCVVREGDYWGVSHSYAGEHGAQLPSAVIKKFGVDFQSEGGALTLSPECIGMNPSGWTITGEIHEDYYEWVIHEEYYEWVNDFKAAHPTLGTVEGNFEDTVYASSEEAFQDFYKNHTPSAWDYWDI